MEELAGTAWTLTHFETAGGTVAALAQSPATLEFTASDPQTGRLAGTSGCNSYTAGYALSGNDLKVTQMLSTRMLCTPPERMEQEFRFYQALPTARSYQRQDDALTIEYTGGTLHFTRAASGTDGEQPASC
jgi:heat shock protein HslJ